MTNRQRLAFRLVCKIGMSYAEAGIIMGISKQAVAKLIGRVKKKQPDIVPKYRPRGKLLRYDPQLDDGQIKEHF